MADNKKKKFFNRELSWLEFNQRVLDMALDEKVPLLERVRFLGISASNLDEFFMVRIGGLQVLRISGGERDDSGMLSQETMEKVIDRVHRMVDEQYRCLRDTLEPQLAQKGIVRLVADRLDPAQAQHVERVFNSLIAPLLTPIDLSRAVDPPLLRNRLLHVAVRCKNTDADDTSVHLAVVPVPRVAGRFVSIPSEGGHTVIAVEELIAKFILRLFPGEEIVECVPFRFARNADLMVRDDLAPDLLNRMTQMIDERKRSACVRLEIDALASKLIVVEIMRYLGMSDDSLVFHISGPIDLTAFMSIADLPGFDALKFEPWPAVTRPALAAPADLFTLIREKNLFLYHPFESFDPVVRLLEQAADDPDVLVIKQTLYRTGSNSAIIAALRRAAQRGKYVTALVELKARFDEERNIEWAKRLEDSGVSVLYGVKGLKTHAKICIIVRREPGGLRRYMHFGTGNYNETTARQYTDVSFMTADEDFGADASAFFNAVTGYSQPQKYRKLTAAPLGLRERLVDLIEAERERSGHGQKTLIMAKMNSLVDCELIEALYKASQAGVEIILNVRGICCLRPGVAGLSETIKVVSILDRFLEHSRIFYFQSGGDERIFISSADWMPRNLDRRIELMVPVQDDESRNRCIDILKTCFKDTANCWQLDGDGFYTRLAGDSKKKRVRSQETLYRKTCDMVEADRVSQPTMFEPHGPADVEK